MRWIIWIYRLWIKVFISVLIIINYTKPLMWLVFLLQMVQVRKESCFSSVTMAAQRTKQRTGVVALVEYSSPLEYSAYTLIDQIWWSPKFPIWSMEFPEVKSPHENFIFFSISKFSRSQILWNKTTSGSEIITEWRKFDISRGKLRQKGWSPSKFHQKD